MAQRVQVLLVDDMNGGEANETVLFGVDGARYEIDLNGENAERLRQIMGPFLASARRVHVTGRGRGTGRDRAARGSRTRSSDIRRWAKTQGIKVSDRGRIPAAVVEQYEAAH